MQSRHSIIYIGRDGNTQDVVCRSLNEIYSAFQLLQTERPPTDGQLCECHFMVIDLDPAFSEGLGLFRSCVRRCPFLRVLAIVRRGDVGAAVQAIRHGAVDCVEKPVEGAQLRAVVERSLCSQDPVTLSTIQSLTRTERIVLAGILQGRTTKAIAAGMHRSPRTIEVHRKHIMRKLQVSTVAGLVAFIAIHCASMEASGICSNAGGGDDHRTARPGIHECGAHGHRRGLPVPRSTGAAPVGRHGSEGRQHASCAMSKL